MVLKYLSSYFVIAGCILIPFINPNLHHSTAIVIAFIPAALLIRLAMGWQLDSSTWRIIRISAISGLLTGATDGVLMGWGGGPDGSPIGEFFGRQLHYSVIGFPILYGVLTCVSGFLAGIAGSLMTKHERRLETAVWREAHSAMARYEVLLGSSFLIFALLYFLGAFGQPATLQPFTLISAVLFGYCLKANRADTAGLISATYLVYVATGVVHLSATGDMHFDGWLYVWRILWPRSGWFLLGASISFGALTLIGFPARFLKHNDAQRRVPMRYVLQHSPKTVAATDHMADSFDEVRRLTSYANKLYSEGRFKDAQSEFQKAVDVCRQKSREGIPGVQIELVRTLRQLGDSYREDFERDEARRCYEEGMRLAERVPDKRELATILHNLGTMELVLGEKLLAARYLNESCELFRAALAQGFTQASEIPNSPPLRLVLERAEVNLRNARNTDAGNT